MRLSDPVVPESFPFRPPAVDNIGLEVRRQAFHALDHPEYVEGCPRCDLNRDET